MSAVVTTPEPTNEPVRPYAPGSAERTALKAALARQAGTRIDIPLRIGGELVETGRTAELRVPHDHALVLGHYQLAGAREVERAIEAATAARAPWAELPWEERASVFLRAAALLAGRRRDRLNAATMLGQSKTVYQAEIDAACELIDFLRFNVHFLAGLMSEQPSSAPGSWNRLDYRPLDGFVLAVTPFNFTSIAGNLPTAPALLGNTVVWKPASAAVLSAHYIMELLEEAGLPPGVINFVPGPAPEVAGAALDSPDLGGVHFTGSTTAFQDIWGRVGGQIDRYRQYPRLVGETGGKDFVFAHASADPEALATGLLRGAFEYQGQKCSAASRAYIPASLWPGVREALYAELEAIRVGDVRDFRNFMGAVIDEPSYRRLAAVLGEARADVGRTVVEVVGGRCDDEAGWFVWPAVIVTSDPLYPTMQRELFGPILTVFVYEDSRFEETLALCAGTSPYALTGSIFGSDRGAITRAAAVLRYAAGNFYINDKPTGAVVGQQPFGGSRASGTNDKAGSILNLQRWVSPRTIKETFVPAREWSYPFLGES